jgi:hypothetical protein
VAPKASTPVPETSSIVNIAAKHIGHGPGGHQFIVEVDLSVSLTKMPEPIRLIVDCPGGGQFIQDKPEKSATSIDSAPPKGGWRTTYRISVPDKIIGGSGGICSLEAAPRGEASGESKKIFIVAR